MTVPFLGRLDLHDYLRLGYTLMILILDKILRIFWPVVAIYIPKSPFKKDKFHHLHNTVEMIEYFGFQVEEHVVFTADGHMLMMFKILPKSPQLSKPPVLMLHGAMLSSDIWILHSQANKNLPLFLASIGYEVWLGNRRGNKYCGKHEKLRAKDNSFWDWSIDEVALFDIPKMVDRVLESSIKGMKCVVIGFSQGSAELFASLSLKQELNEKIVLAIGLAAMTRPALSGPSAIASLVHSPPELLYLLFGRKALLSSVLFWINSLPNRVYSRMIDLFLKLLFGWDCQNIRIDDRKHMYLKMYSQTSVKTIAHWFQMARDKKFQMFDESDGHFPAPYPLRQVRVPVVLFTGSRDTIADSSFSRHHLKHCLVEDITIDGYEHLDFLMAHNVHEALFPTIESILNKLKMTCVTPKHSRVNSDLSLS